MQRLKQLEDENRRLKQIVAEQTLDIQALKARPAPAEIPSPHLRFATTPLPRCISPEECCQFSDCTVRTNFESDE